MNVAIVCDPPHAVLVHKPTWVADGFRAAGHSVRLVHDLAGVRAADTECDLVLFDHKASGMNRAALAELAHSRLSLRESAPFAERKATQRTVWVQWWRDLVAMDANKRLADQEHVRSFGGVMRGMDVVFVKERSLLDEYHRLGINAHWLDQACPADMPACEHRGKGDGYVLPEYPPLPLGEGRGEGGLQWRTHGNSIRPHPNPLPEGEGTSFAQNVPVPFCPERPEWDVLVLGSPGYAQRRADARVLAEAGFRVLWAGMAASDPVPPGVEWHPWVHPLKLPELVSRCGVVLGVDWRSDLPGYTSDRTYLACGMGACYVARYTDCGSEFPPASYAPQAALAAWIYDSTEQLLEIVRHAMSDVTERRRRGAWSRQCVMEGHTYAHRAAEIIKIVGDRSRSSAAASES